MEGSIAPGLPPPNGAGDPERMAPPDGVQVQHPGVLVLRVPDEDGDSKLQIIELNNIDPLAVPMTLRLAAKIKEQSLGV